MLLPDFSKTVSESVQDFQSLNEFKWLIRHFMSNMNSKGESITEDVHPCKIK